MDKSLIAALILWPVAALAQTHTMPGSNVVPSGASLTIQSGGTINAAAGSTVTGFGAGGGAPTTSTYVTQTADAGLSAEFALSTLATGLLKNTTGTGALSIVTDNSANWNTAFTQMLQWDGGSTNLVAATGRNSLGGTTVGQSFFTLTNPGAITFPEISAGNVVSTKTAAQLKTDLSLTSTDVGLGSVTNNAQTQAAIVPNTAPSAGQILIGNAGNTAYAKQTLSGSGATASLGATGVLTISAIPESSLSITNVTTGDATTSAHGFAPKGTVGTTQFWRQDWTLAVPSGGAATAGGSDTQVQFNDGGTVLGGDAGMTYSKTTDVLTLVGSTTTPTFKIGTLEFQDYGLGNAWIGENAYFDGAWKYRATGPAGLFYFFGAEGQFKLYPSGTGGTALPGASSFSSQLKMNADGSVGLGGQGNVALGGYDGFFFLIRGATAQIAVPSNRIFGWSSSSSDVSATMDTAFSRNAAGVVEVNNGTAGTYRDLKADEVNAVTGFQVNGAAPSNYELTGNGTDFVSKASDIPNGSSAQQTGFAANTYLAGSVITLNAGDFKVGGTYRCMFDMAKTTAGTAAPVITIYIGTAGTTSDTAAQTITFAAATGVADTGMFEVWVNFRAVGASATISSVGRCVHNLAATGLTSTGASGSGTISNSTSSTFNSTAMTKIGCAFNGGTSYVGTNNIVQAFYQNP